MSEYDPRPFDLQRLEREVPCYYCGWPIRVGESARVTFVRNDVAEAWGHPDCNLLASRLIQTDDGQWHTELELKIVERERITALRQEATLRQRL